MKKRIKRITAVAAAAALAISFTFPAEPRLADLGFGGNAIVASAETSGDWQYYDEGSNIKIVKYIGSGDSADIPAVIDGKPVTAIGDGAFTSCTGLTSITIPSSVTSIGGGAFTSCTGLTSITIPSSVTSIGVNAFQDCTGLTNITVDSNNPSYCSESGVLFNKDKTTLIYYPLGKTDSSYNIPDGVTAIKYNAFWGCIGLTSVTIPSSVTSIGENAFRNCSGLTSITIPSSVKTIEYFAFGGCSSLTIIYMPSGINFPPDTSIGLPNDAFPSTAAKITYTVDSSTNSVTITKIELPTGQNTVDIPAVIDGKTVTAIGEYAFWNCSELTSITIPNSVTSIGYYAFGNCSGLTSITIPNSVTSIGYYAFWNCSGLTSITIPSSVTSIGIDAFGNCSGLTSVTIPSSVTSIGVDAFENCSGLKTIYIPSGVQLGSNAIPDTAAKITYTVDSSTNSVTITEIELPTGQNTVDIPATIDGKPVTSIGKSAFVGCSELTSITIPNSVTSIETGAFWGCSGLTSITIPSSVTSIGHYAFRSCSGLTSVTIPSSVTSIGISAFENCSGLKTIYIPSGAQLGSDAIPDTAAKITYTVDSSTNSVTITKIELPTGQNTVNIPAMIDGKTVTAVAEEYQNLVGSHEQAHILNKTEKQAHTCTDDGNIEYWSCSLCGKKFSDANGINEITNIVDPARHSLVKTDAKAPTCTDDGNIEYWECSVCGKKFSNSNGTNEITNIVDPASGHSLVKTDAKAPTCTDDGNIAYWECSVCGKKFSDSNGTNEITNIVDPAKHSLVKTDAKAPTCTDDGNKAYWTCTECGNIFSDDAGLNPTTLADVTISAANHNWSNDWSYDGTGHWHVCLGCNEKVDFEAHTENSGTITIQPTAATTGVRVYSCSVCGYGLRTVIIPATGDNGDNVISTPSVFTENLTVNAEESGSTVILSWNGVKNADKYYVYQYKDRKYVRIKTTTDTSVEINGLKNGETYKFLVRYTIGGVVSPMTYSYKITVNAYYKPVVKAASTENSVKLTWKAVPNAEKYAVYKYVDGKAVKLCETEKLAVRINKLSPDTEYKYIVRAYVDGKWTAMMTSDIVTIETNAE